MVGLFFGHFEYNTAIWYILWPFVNLVAIWYIFPSFGKFRREKSCNPATDSNEALKFGAKKCPHSIL
jgi:hypothetical protein